MYVYVFLFMYVYVLYLCMYNVRNITLYWYLNKIARSGDSASPHRLCKGNKKGKNNYE